jgi:RNA polymerase sigma-70 factor (ECF subfamily)
LSLEAKPESDDHQVPSPDPSTGPLPNHYELSDPDVRLMLLVKQGNAGAFEQLVRLYQDRVLAILKQLVPHPQNAEDLTQDVFLRIYRARLTYEPNAKFSTWVFTIAQNVAKNALRQYSRQREQQVPATGPDRNIESLEQMATDASGLQPARQLDRLEMGEVVRRALELLPERQRVAVWLAKFENMSYQEIADSMGLSIPAIKSLLSRARNNLKEALQPYLESGMLPQRATREADDSDQTTDI